MSYSCVCGHWFHLHSSFVQMLRGFQSDPSACWFRGRHFDGKLMLMLTLYQFHGEMFNRGFFLFFFFKSLIWSGCQICYWGVCCRWGEVLGTAQHSTGRTQNRYMLVDIKMLWSNSKLHYFMMNSAFLAKVCLKEDISRQFLKPSINVSKKEWT